MGPFFLAKVGEDPIDHPIAFGDYRIASASLQGEAYRRAALAAGLIEVIAKSQLASELDPILKRLIVADLRRQVTPESNVTGSVLR